MLTRHKLNGVERGRTLAAAPETSFAKSGVKLLRSSRSLHGPTFYYKLGVSSLKVILLLLGDYS